MRSRFPVGTLSAASLIVVVVALAAVILGRPAAAPTVGASAAPSTSAPVASAPVASPAASAPAATAPVASAPVAVVPTPKPSTALRCDLTARIVSWEGAAGQRIATVDMTNQGKTDCLLQTLPRPELVDGDGKTLIEGAPSSGGTIIQFKAGAHASTLVAVGNWCKAVPKAPISVAFVFGTGQRLVAAPLSPTDLTLPPCNGPSQPATISMHPWSPA